MKAIQEAFAMLGSIGAEMERSMNAAVAGLGLPGSASAERLSEIGDFGPNPGGLRLLAYVPATLSPRPGLIVALHGCGQTAAAYDHGSGWSRLADRHGFVLVLPEQSIGNNPTRCFSWYSREHARRGGGEAASIRQMVAHMSAAHAVDPERVFLVGLSAGAAMAGVLLASYPEVFRGGALIAGLPVGAARSVSEALSAMAKGRVQAPELWGDHVRTASPHDGPWPRVSIWQGSADGVVHPSNAESLAAQWVNVHGLAPEASEEHSLGGHCCRRWRDARGGTVVEIVTIAGMGHGVPLALDGAESSEGASGAYHFDVGVSSSRHIVHFFGLERKTEPVREVVVLPVKPPSPAPAYRAGSGGAASAKPAGPEPKPSPLRGVAAPGGVVRTPAVVPAAPAEAPPARVPARRDVVGERRAAAAADASPGADGASRGALVPVQPAQGEKAGGLVRRGLSAIGRGLRRGLRAIGLSGSERSGG